ncbi:hypothetical protein [Ferrovibrio terrae]|uniref:hypothetical protein n=1 Tax=Ferrovibrio terrae TaxID=2594003 RepID=UPI00313803DF
MATDLTSTSQTALATAETTSMGSLLHLEDNDGNWLPPRVVTDQLRLQARAMLADMPRRMAPAKPESIANWLASLGVLCAGKISVEDAKLKIAAYVSVLEGEFEAGCYTEGSLKRIYPQFTWFPAGGEIHAALLREKRRLWVERGRLRKLADGDRGVREDRPPPTQEQQDRVAEAMRDSGLLDPGKPERHRRAAQEPMTEKQKDMLRAGLSKCDFGGGVLSDEQVESAFGETNHVSRETPDAAAPAESSSGQGDAEAAQ